MLNAKRKRLDYPPTTGPGLVAVLAALGALVVSIPLVLIELALLYFSLDAPGGWLLHAVVGSVSIALSAGCLYLIWREQPLFPLFGGRWEARLRLAEFARINRFDYAPRAAAPFSPLDPQAIPGTAVVSDRLILASSPALEVGNLDYHVHSWARVTDIRTGYFAMERPPEHTASQTKALQRSVDRAALDVTVSADKDWILLSSDAGFDLLAPQTYRVLLWIAAQTDARQGSPQPISSEAFVAEAKRLAWLRESHLSTWLFLGAVAFTAMWFVAVLVAQIQN